jgi:hypothetical protein
MDETVSFSPASEASGNRDDGVDVFTNALEAIENNHTVAQPGSLEQGAYCL